MARLGRALPQAPGVARLPVALLIQLTVTADVTGATTAAATAAAGSPVTADLAGSATAVATVAGLATIPQFRPNRGPFGRA